MKAFSTLFSLFMLLLFLYPSMAQAAERQQPKPLLLFLDGKQLSAEVAPQINRDGNTIVPVRIIAQSLGSKVQWEEKARKVTLERANVNIQMFIDKRNAIVNDKPVMLETAPTIIKGNTMLPIRFISEQFGIKVTWDELTQSVFLIKQENGIQDTAIPPAVNPSSAVGGKIALVTPDKGAAVEASNAGVKPPASQAPETKDQAGVKPASQAPETKDQVDVKPPASQAPVIKDQAVKKQPAADSFGSKSLESPQTQTKPADKQTDKPTPLPGSKPVNAGVKPADVAAAKDKPVVAPVSGTGASSNTAISPIIIQSISVKNEKLIVQTSGGKAVPTVTKSKNPNRIQIDIPNAKLDLGLKLNPSGEGTVSENSHSISQIRYLLFSKESSIVRIIVDLNQKIDFQTSPASSPNQLVWSLVPAKERYTVVIDPGHGGKDTGAISITNRLEKDFVLALGTKVFHLLAKEPKVEAVLTRNNDTFVELTGRTVIANNLDADLFVSIHGNSTINAEVAGVETYYYSEESLPFAKIMHEQIVKSSGFPDRKVKQNDFYVVEHTNMPSLLLELGFLSNKAEEEAMFKDAYQNQVAASIVAGIKQQLNIE
jgi:N-acetylmuramoyl-L-alanine amidase